MFSRPLLVSLSLLLVASIAEADPRVRVEEVSWSHTGYGRGAVECRLDLIETASLRAVEVRAEIPGEAAAGLTMTAATPSELVTLLPVKPQGEAKVFVVVFSQEQRESGTGTYRLGELRCEMAALSGAVPKVTAIGLDGSGRQFELPVEYKPLETSRDFGATTRLSLVPNPAQGSVAVRYLSLVAGRVEVLVFDLEGRLVKSVFQGPVEAGDREWVWDGEDEAGRPAPASVYFIRVTSDRESAVRRLTFLR